MVRKGTIVAAALALLLAPAAARADWLLTPNVGAVFAGSVPEGSPVTVGASIAWMSGGVLGVEGDFSYTPNFFEGGAGGFVSDSNVTTAMGNVVFGLPFGGTRGTGLRPYAVAGLGLLQTQADGVDELFDVSRSSWGGNVGGGLMAFVSDNVGFRGDLRYFRGFSNIADFDEIFDDARVDYWRATGGVTFRW